MKRTADRIIRRRCDTGQLEMCRQFYRIYPIANTLCSQLNWSQYKLLISIPDPDKREYYQLEAINGCWSKRQLERQINSMLYERLLMSNDKEKVLEKLCRHNNDIVCLNEDFDSIVAIIKVLSVHTVKI